MRATIIYFPREKHEIESLCDTLADDKNEQLALRLVCLPYNLYPVTKIVQNLSLSEVFVVEMKQLLYKQFVELLRVLAVVLEGDELHLILAVNILKALIENINLDWVNDMKRANSISFRTIYIPDVAQSLDFL